MKASYVTQQVGIEENSSVQSFQLFPNPASDILNLEFSLNQRLPLRLEILTPTGQQVYSRDMGMCEGSIKTGISLSALPAGIYGLRIIAGDQNLTRTFIME